MRVIVRVRIQIHETFDKFKDLVITEGKKKGIKMWRKQNARMHGKDLDNMPALQDKFIEWGLEKMEEENLFENDSSGRKTPEFKNPWDNLEDAHTVQME